MENTLFINVKKLYDYELYSQVIYLASLLRTANKNCPGLLTWEQDYQLFFFEANSYFYERNFRNAELYYRYALQAKNNLNKQNHSINTSFDNTYEHFSDSETKYRLAVCLKEINRIQEAVSVLQSIPNKLRNPKINMLLAKLQHHDLKDNIASLSYKEVLRECPLALEAIKSLLEIGVSGIEVNSLVVNVSSTPQCSDWLSNWIKGHDLMYKQKFLQAVEALKTINQSSKLRNNEHLLVLIGECYYYSGSYENALRFLQQVNMKKPHMIEGLQTLAVLYSKKNKLQELEKLAMPGITISEYKSENWFALAQCLYTSGKYAKAAYFAQKSIYHNSKNVEAYLLKVKIFFELKKYCEALKYLRSAQNISHWRFEVYKGLVNCYLAQSRLRDAQTVAAHALRISGQTPRSLVLLARSFYKDPMMQRKAKSFLKQALEIDEYYFPAVILLAEVLQNEGDTASAIILLKKQVSIHPNCKLYLMLGDILNAEKDFEKAFDNYTVALNLDPKNAHALAGLNALGRPLKNTNKQEDSSYSIAAADEGRTVEYYSDPSFETEVSNVVNGEGESESETIWSDVEVEVN